MVHREPARGGCWRRAALHSFWLSLPNFYHSRMHEVLARRTALRGLAATWLSIALRQRRTRA